MQAGGGRRVGGATSRRGKTGRSTTTGGPRTRKRRGGTSPRSARGYANSFGNASCMPSMHELDRHRGEDEPHDAPDDVDPRPPEHPRDHRGRAEHEEREDAHARRSPSRPRTARGQVVALPTSTITVAIAPGPREERQPHRDDGDVLLRLRLDLLFARRRGSRIASRASSRAPRRRAGSRPRS